MALNRAKEAPKPDWEREERGKNEERKNDGGRGMPNEKGTRERVEPLDQRLHLRLTKSEKAMIELLASTARMSVSRLLVEAARIVGEARVRQSRARLLNDAVSKTGDHPKRRKRKKGPPKRSELRREFRAPFMRAADGAAFERVVTTSAKRMGISPFSAARLLTFVIEETAKEVAAGEVVRFPAFMVIGPYFTPNARGIEGCLPRIQASVPFRDFVQQNCHSRDNKNRELQAHRRRRRARLTSVISAMEAFRHRVEKHDDEYLEAFERWREFGHTSED